METSTYSDLEYNIDKNLVPPIEQKRIVAFINNFVINTVTFLNKFAVNCETKFIDFESKLQKVESSLLILEAKLTSIPELEIASKNTETITTEVKTVEGPPAAIETTIQPSTTIVATTTDTVDKIENKNVEMPDSGSNNTNNNLVEENITPAAETSVSSGVKACEDQRYKKYFKMMQFGVPAPAVKIKMEGEGFDSNILDNPNRILEDGIRADHPE